MDGATRQQPPMEPGRRCEAEPDPSLRRLVICYWGRSGGSRTNFCVTPDCFVELLVFRARPLMATPDGLVRLPSCFVIPLLDAPLELVFDRPSDCAAIRFSCASAPFAGPPIAGTPCCEPIPALGAAARHVRSALRRGAWPAIVALFDRTLLENRALQPAEADRTVAERLTSSPRDGITSSLEIGRDTGRSRRHVERRIRHATSAAPQHLARLARFQFVRDTLWMHPQTSLVTLAADAGYADQAHLTREFRRFAGVTPGVFRRVQTS